LQYTFASIGINAPQRTQSIKLPIQYSEQLDKTLHHPFLSEIKKIWYSLPLNDALIGIIMIVASSALFFLQPPTSETGCRWSAVTPVRARASPLFASPQLAWISPTPDPDSISKSGVEGIEGEFCLNRVVIASYLFYDPLRVGDDDDDDDDALMRSVLRLSRLLSRLGHGTVTCSVGLERPVVL